MTVVVDEHHVPLDIERLTECLHRHRVEYLLVGGLGAQLHGGSRPTGDFDAVVARSPGNLERLAAALGELNAYMRVGRITDEEAKALPTRVDVDWLRQIESSTWRTDAGDVDVLTGLQDRSGRQVGYDALMTRAHQVGAYGTVVQVVALDDLIAAKERANRPKDREALPELRWLASQQPPTPKGSFLRPEAPRPPRQEPPGFQR